MSPLYTPTPYVIWNSYRQCKTTAAEQLLSPYNESVEIKLYGAHKHEKQTI